MSLEDLVLSLGKAASSFQCKRNIDESRIEHCSHEIDVHVTEHERNRSISPLNVKEDDSFVLLRDCWLIQLLKATFVRKDGGMN